MNHIFQQECLVLYGTLSWHIERREEADTSRRFQNFYRWASYDVVLLCTQYFLKARYSRGLKYYQDICALTTFIIKESTWTRTRTVHIQLWVPAGGPWPSLAPDWRTHTVRPAWNPSSFAKVRK